MPVDARSPLYLRWLLAGCGVLGLFGAVSMLLASQVEFGHSIVALHIANWLPSWALWVPAPPAGVPMLIVGLICGLLLGVGRWPAKVLAGSVAVWFVYAQSAFGSGSTWAVRMEQAFDFTPFRIGGLVGVIALLAVSLLALVIAARPMGVTQTP
jgi:hypothetical protein